MRSLVAVVTGLASVAAGSALSLLPTPVVAAQPTVRTPLPTLQPLPTLDMAPAAPVVASRAVRAGTPCTAVRLGTTATWEDVTHVCTRTAAGTHWRVVAA